MPITRISTSAFTLETEEQGEHSVRIRLHGELDLAVALEARELAERSLDAGWDLDVDLSGLEFVDSTGLLTLLRVRERAEALDRRLTLIGPLQSQVRRIMRLAGVAHLMPQD